MIKTTFHGGWHAHALRWLGILAAMFIACCIATSSASAQNTVAISSATAIPEQSIPIQFTFSGSADYTNGSYTGVEVRAVVRPAGALPCQASAPADYAAAGDADFDLLDSDEQNGPFSVAGSYDPSNVGSYLVCAWAEAPDNDSDTLAGPATAMVAARGPQVPVFTVSLPTAPSPNTSFQIAYTTQTDQQLKLDSLIKPAGGAPCAATFELEQQQDENNAAANVLMDYQSVYGGPTTNTTDDSEAAGGYVICSWIEGPTDSEVDAAATTPVDIPAPTPPAPKPASARLRLTKGTASHRHGASIVGTTAKGLVGRVVVYASCARSTTSTSPVVKNGRFSGHVKLPKACRSRRYVAVGAVWAGSSLFAKQSVSERVRIKK